MDPSRNDIERYLNNQMSDAERHALEKKALSDPFLADAIEGAQSVKPEEFAGDVQALHRRIQPASPAWTMSVRIAAGVMLAVTLGWLIWRSPSSAPETLPLLTENTPVSDSTKDRSGDTQAAKPVDATENKEALAQERRTTPVPAPSSAPARAEPAAGVAVPSPEPVTLADSKTEVAEEEAAPAVRKTADAPSSFAEKRASQPSKSVTGKVTEAEDNIPLADAVVVELTTHQETRTRADGTYTLPVTTDRPVLQYSFPGLQSVEQRAGGQESLNVQLPDDARQRSEVIAFPPPTWSGSATDELKLAVPGMGVQAYQEFLESNQQLPSPASAAGVSGKVTIAFTVDETGALTNFRVVKSLGYGCDEEAIRLLKTGPAWKAARYRQVPVASEVWLKLEFGPAR